MQHRLAWALAIGALAMFTLGGAGCSGDDGSRPTVQSTCELYCNKQKDCDDTISVEDCVLYSCGNLDQAARACQDALKVFFECKNAASDVCDTANCTAEETAYHEAC